MSNADASSGRLFTAVVLVLAAIAIAIWLFVTFNQSGALPVKMDSPPFALTNMNGEQVTEARYDNKVRLMSFIFTRCPDICPATTANMTLLQDELKQLGLFGGEVEFVSITFDPENDTPEVLSQYAERMRIDQSGWTLLRGEEKAVQELAGTYNISIVKLDDGQFVHSITSLLLIDGKQRVRSIYKMGEDMDNAVIIEDIRALVQELEQK